MELSTKLLSDVTIYMKYAKYLPELKRRETWSELVTRNKNMHVKKFPKLKDEIEEAYKFVYDRQILPSMRSMQFGGRPIELNPVRLYNCSFLPMDSSDSFAELMFLLLSGTGVGYSVQTHHVKKLPVVRQPKKSKRHLIGDSIEGWADAVKVLMRAYFEDKPQPVFDYGDIRPKGARLVTSGGKAPGPEPLRHCLEEIHALLKRKKEGEKLTTLEVHDICCLIADCVLAGGIRRAAMISLFDIDDESLLTCKGWFHLPPVGNEINHNYEADIHQFYVEYLGRRFSITLSNGEYSEYEKTYNLPWYYVAAHRGRANNSAVVIRHKISKERFYDLFKTIRESTSGEPGIFFSNDKEYGINPCGEVSLKPYQFCNLVTINASDVHDQEELNKRSKAAAFIATLQASYTDFHYLRDIWKETTDKEALIGVSMTGIASGGVLKLKLEEAAEVVKKENDRVAKLIDINKAARCTVIKPEGTSSLVLGSSSGIHAWHAKYYLRRIRVGKNEAIYKYIVKNHPELVEDEYFRPQAQAVITVPQQAPAGAITREESALDLLNRVSLVWNKWIKTGHRKGSNINNVSTTVSVREKEWDDVGEWMWKHKDEYTALSVLPFDPREYKQPPFEDISKTQYEKLVKSLHELDLTKIIEDADDTKLQENVACGGGACEIT